MHVNTSCKGGLVFVVQIIAPMQTHNAVDGRHELHDDGFMFGLGPEHMTHGRLSLKVRLGWLCIS